MGMRANFHSKRGRVEEGGAPIVPQNLSRAPSTSKLPAPTVDAALQSSKKLRGHVHPVREKIAADKLQKTKKAATPLTQQQKLQTLQPLLIPSLLWADQMHIDRLPSREMRLVVRQLVNIKNYVEEFFKALFRSSDTRQNNINRALDALCDQLKPILNLHKSNNRFLQNLALAEFEEMSLHMLESSFHKDPASLAGFTRDFQTVLRSKLSREMDQVENLAQIGTILSNVLQRASSVVAHRYQGSSTLQKCLINSSSLARYIVDINGDVRTAALEEPLKEGEWEFQAMSRVELDIPRDGAWVNGRAYHTIEDLIRGLLEGGAPKDRIGDMVSLFAQNTCNTVAGVVNRRYGGDITIYSPSRYQTLTIDLVSKNFRFDAMVKLVHYSPDDGDDLESQGAIYIQGGRSIHGVFTAYTTLEGTLKDSHEIHEDFQLHESLADLRAHVVDPTMEDFAAASTFMIRELPALNEDSRALLAKRKERLREELTSFQEMMDKIEKVMHHIEHLQESAGKSLKTGRGAGRVRAKRRSIKDQIELAQKRLEDLDLILSRELLPHVSRGSLMMQSIKSLQKEELARRARSLEFFERGYEQVKKIHINQMEDEKAAAWLAWADQEIRDEIIVRRGSSNGLHLP